MGFVFAVLVIPYQEIERLKAMLRHPHRVQILPVNYLEYFREATVGAHQYAMQSGRAIIVDRWLPHDVELSLKRLVKADRVQGLIVMVHTPDEDLRLSRLNIPVVNLSNAIEHPRLSVVTQDDREVGRKAAQHLRECGCEYFAYWGEKGQRYARLRMEGFTQALDPLRPILGEGQELLHSPREQQRRIRKFVARLPGRTGIFCCREWPAVGLLQAARELGRRVPEDLAILSAGEDSQLGNFEGTPLSSVRLPAREIGAEGMHLLCDLIETREKVAARLVEVPVSGISVRRSTDVVMCSDAFVSRALRLIREHPGCSAAEVAAAAGLSRTALQPRFKKAVGCGVMSYIRKARAERAHTLIRESKLKLEQVAFQCGLGSLQSLHVLIRQHFHCSPGQLRD